jgi:heptosyltransferase I
MKVLVVKVSALGDVVHALPVLAYLKGVDPGMSIDWVVEEPFAPLLIGHPLITTVHCIHTRLWRTLNGFTAGVHGILGIARTLRRQRYDVVLDLQGNSKSGLISLSTGAARRYGFDTRSVREPLNLIGTNRRVTVDPDDHHVSARLLRIARNAFHGDIPLNCAGPLSPSPVANLQAAGILRDLPTQGKPLVVFHCGTSWATKLWAVESWQELAGRVVRELGAAVLLTWGSHYELEVACQVQSAAEGAAFLWPKGDLPQLTALLAQVNAVVGGDTGPVHIAAALGTPTVSFYRVTDARRNGPCGRQHRTLQAPLSCSPCLQKRCRRDLECSLAIPVATVFEALSDLLSQPAPPDQCISDNASF